MSSILSVGIDIGTSTTQVIFSRITMDNMAGYFSAPRIAITGKELIYKSKIHFTPLKPPYCWTATASGTSWRRSSPKRASGRRMWTQGR